MRIDTLFIWQEWPPARQKAFFQALLAAWMGLLALIWILLAGATAARSREAAALAAKHQQIKPMVDEILRLKAQKGALAGLGPMPAAQQVIREMGLEAKLASIRPTQVAGGGDGVQLLLEGFNLPEMIKLLENLGERGGLKIISFSLSHRLDSAKLADLQMVLGR